MAAPAPSTSWLEIKLRELDETYWFWPLLLGLSGLSLALIVLWIDRTTTAKAFYAAYPWIAVPPESARAVFTVIASAMISAASIIYSLSLLIRTVAIGTLGPRLIEIFDKVRVNRLTLGVQLFSFIYSLTILYSVGNIVGPHTLAVAIGILIALIALVYLVIFVHSVAQQAHVDATIADIGATVLERIEHETTEGGEDDDDRPADGKGTVLASEWSGYVQGIDRKHAFNLACEHDIAVVYEVRSGDYVVAGTPLLRVVGARNINGDQRDALRATVTLGPQRIDVEDLRFQCLLLVEIALRALSPGINDPYTAVSCIDNLGGVLARVNGRDLTPDPLRDHDDQGRVFSRKLTYQDFVDAIFHPLRQSGARAPVVAICLLDRLGDLVTVTERAEAKKHLLRHAELIGVAAVEATTDKADEKSIKDRLAVIRKQADVSGGRPRSGSAKD